jgi:hypothetical protein
MFDSIAQREAVAHVAARIRERRLLLVSPAKTSWVVQGPPLPREQSFPTKEQAIVFARHWARDHRPSVVRLELERGQAAGEWEYDAP